MNALYDAISRPAGQNGDWDRMRALFAPGARLMRRTEAFGSVVHAFST